MINVCFLLKHSITRLKIRPTYQTTDPMSCRTDDKTFSPLFNPLFNEVTFILLFFNLQLNFSKCMQSAVQEVRLRVGGEILSVSVLLAIQFVT